MTDKALVINILFTGLIIISAILIGIHLHEYYFHRVLSVIISAFIGIFFITALWGVSVWYYRNTEAGRKELAEEFDNTTKKTIEVYDNEGNMINTYVIIEEEGN